jgi:hypothetical protein
VENLVELPRAVQAVLERRAENDYRAQVTECIETVFLGDLDDSGLEPEAAETVRTVRKQRDELAAELRLALHGPAPRGAAREDASIDERIETAMREGAAYCIQQLLQSAGVTTDEINPSSPPSAS